MTECAWCNDPDAPVIAFGTGDDRELTACTRHGGTDAADDPLPQNAERLVNDWRRRAERLEAYARRLRSVGDVSGDEGAADAETAALDYRWCADDLEARIEARSGR